MAKDEIYLEDGLDTLYVGMEGDRFHVQILSNSCFVDLSMAQIRELRVWIEAHEL